MKDVDPTPSEGGMNDLREMRQGLRDFIEEVSEPDMILTLSICCILIYIVLRISYKVYVG
jgi:hypothetical protein